MLMDILSGHIFEPGSYGEIVFLFAVHGSGLDDGTLHCQRLEAVLECDRFGPVARPCRAVFAFCPL